MKNLKNKMLVILAVATFVFIAYAIELVPASTLENRAQKDTTAGRDMSCEMYFTQQPNAFGKITIEEVPQAIRSAVLLKYVAYSIDDVFQDWADSYKLILKSGKNKRIVYYTEEGEFLREEKVKVVEMVALI